jgi:hypothetical protein
MKKVILQLLCFLIIEKVSSQNNFTIAAGYGMRGVTIKADYKFDQIVGKNFKPIVYADLGIQGKSFKELNFTFNGIRYPSDVRVLFVGVGAGLELQQKNLILTPFVGLKYAYARFKDRALVDAIGNSNGLQRSRGGVNVGPVVENGYGDVYSLELGTRIGYKISKNISFFTSVAISPIKFSTAATLFGKYWGEAPGANNYYIKYPILNAEGGIRLHF